MKKTILLGNCNDYLLKFLKEKFNCTQLIISNKNDKDKKFTIYDLEDFIYNEDIENIFITEEKDFSNIFYKNAFIESRALSKIKNIFIISEQRNNLIKFTDRLPYFIIENSLNLEYKKDFFYGGILKKNQNTRDIKYNFNPTFKFILSDELIIFRKNKLEEEKLYIDFTYLNNYYSLLSKSKLESFSPINSIKKGELILFSNLLLKNNETFYKYIIQKEINR